jgi:hypothetical protein
MKALYPYSEWTSKPQSKLTCDIHIHLFHIILDKKMEMYVLMFLYKLIVINTEEQ